MTIYKLENLVEIISGKKVISNSNGNIPIVGSGGIFGYTNKCIVKSPTFTLPRKGTMKITWFDEDIWNVDTAFAVKKMSNEINLKYLFYYLKSKNGIWKKIITGSTRPATKISDWRKLEVDIPEISIQNKIIDIIEPMEILRNKLEFLKIKTNSFILALDTNKSESKKLSKISKIITGKRNANHANNKGKYHFFTCSNKNFYCNEYSFDTAALLVAGNGDVGKVKYYNGKFDAYQRTYVIQDCELIGNAYLSFLKNKRKLEGDSAGSVLKFLVKSDIENINVSTDKETNEIIVYNLSIIQIIDELLKKINETINLALSILII